MYSKTLQTPLGNMLAIAEENFLLMLDFVDGNYFERNRKFFHEYYINRSNKIIDLLENELNLYFNKKLTNFSVPVKFYGTIFQNKVWKSLQQIPYGKIISYMQLSENMNITRSVRAVAAANSCNKISIVVPCHRVIRSNGNLTGYAGGYERKRYLIDLERTNSSELNS
jgi:O-6-methylguanine DNA methyltransferase